MRRTLVCALVATIVGTVALVWAGSAQAPRRIGNAEKVVVEDQQVCKNGGRFVVAYTEQRRLSIVIETADGLQLAAKSFTPEARPYTFDPTLDPLQTGFREFSSRFNLRWPKTQPGTSLVVNIFGDPNANPETFPNSRDATPIVVAKCRLSKGDDRDKDDCGDEKDDNDDNDDNDDKGNKDNDDDDNDNDDND